MLKTFSRLTICLFFLVAALAPYLSAMKATIVRYQNAQEKTESNQSFEEKIFDTQVLSHMGLQMISLESTFPFYLALKPQQFINDFIRPPRS
jgi:hypothetical protein